MINMMLHVSKGNNVVSKLQLLKLDLRFVEHSFRFTGKVITNNLIDRHLIITMSLLKSPLVASTCTLTLALPSRQDLSQPRRVRSPPGEGAGAHQQTQQPAGAVPQHRGRPEDPGHDQVTWPPRHRPAPPHAVLSLSCLSSASTDCSAANDTRWRMAAERKTTETPPTAATPPSTVTRLVPHLQSAWFSPGPEW